MKYNTTIADESLTLLLDNIFLNIVRTNKEFTNYAATNSEFVRINGKKAGKKIASVYNSALKRTYKIQGYTFRKDNELWYVQITYDQSISNGEDKANTIIGSIVFK